MNEMTPDTRPLSQQMSLDGMYSGIVEKWAAEVAGLEARIEALFEHRRVFQCERTVLKCKTCDELIAALTAKEEPCPR